MDYHIKSESEWIAYGFDLLNRAPTAEMLDSVIELFEKIHEQNPKWSAVTDALAALLTDRAGRLRAGTAEEKWAAVCLLERAASITPGECSDDRKVRRDRYQKLREELCTEYRRQVERKLQENDLDGACQWYKKILEASLFCSTFTSARKNSEEKYFDYFRTIIKQFSRFRDRSGCPSARIQDCDTGTLIYLKSMLEDCCMADYPCFVLIDECRDEEVGRYFLCAWHDKWLLGGLKEFISDYMTETRPEEEEYIQWQVKEGCVVLHDLSEVEALEHHLLSFEGNRGQKEKENMAYAAVIERMKAEAKKKAEAKEKEKEGKLARAQEGAGQPQQATGQQGAAQSRQAPDRKSPAQSQQGDGWEAAPQSPFTDSSEAMRYQYMSPAERTQKAKKFGEDMRNMPPDKPCILTGLNIPLNMMEPIAAQATKVSVGKVVRNFFFLVNEFWPEDGLPSAEDISYVFVYTPDAFGLDVFDVAPYVIDLTLGHDGYSFCIKQEDMESLKEDADALWQKYRKIRDSKWRDDFGDILPYLRASVRK